VLVYLAYTDKLIEGSPQNSNSSVPIMPWGTQEPPKCKDFLEE
jgi:CreA protein